MNFARNEPALDAVIHRWVAPADAERARALFDRLGADCAERLDALAAVADAHPPVLHQYTAGGDRVDRIEYHPDYLALCRAAYHEYGLSAMSHRGVHGWTGKVPHLVKYLASYLFVQVEFGLACPVSMTDAAARVLSLFGDQRFFEPWIDALVSTDPSTSMTGAMFMTELQAGTDIAQTGTRAVRDGDRWRLSGRKWFASNPDADVIVTLARFPGGEEESTRGVGMFMVPRMLPDGTRNSYTIDRLKDKLGTRSMPSGEVTLDGAVGFQVGALERGFRQMAEMVNTSRLSNAMRSSALMRRAVRDAAAHARERIVFGRPLFEQPLMRATLLPLALDSDAALALVAYTGHQLERADTGDPEAKALTRVLTPIAKHYICKRARAVTGEAMEVRGGNGYIEEWGFARRLRDSHLGSIWEGSSNVIALDVLRCMRKSAAHRAVAAAMRGVLSSLGPQHSDAAGELASRWDALVERGDALLDAEAGVAEARCARYTDALAQAIMATLLYDLAAHAGTERAGLVADAYHAGLDGDLHGDALARLEQILPATAAPTDPPATAIHAPVPAAPSAAPVPDPAAHHRHTLSATTGALL
ncbi:acyl-CoA dehydrogenase family protein [Tomitella fengzijianii]|uniref:acyl-CoA dehydrogenase family protein n=1 Tax=Tomitella fengzijianii TaxID=2597660 RepID=UPI00131D3FFA|nr:acyl-CoA dehydrogenase family protein [Tomitella fengzijianii]